MARKRSTKRNKLINMYHSKLKFVSYEAFKVNYHLLHVLYDQYHRALQYLDEEKKEEDRLISEFNLKKKKKA